MAGTDIPYNFTAEELIKAGRVSRYNIDGIREWLELMPTIPYLSDEQIGIFLIACKNDTEATKNCIMCYFKYKAASPEIFANRDIDGEEMTYTFSVSKVGLTSYRTKDNYAVVTAALKDTSYSNFHVESQAKMVYMLLDVVLCDNPPDGLVIIINIKGVGLMHITRLKLAIVKKFFQFLQEALPTQLKQIHIMNTNYVFDKIIMVLKPFMSRELFDMIVTHPPNEDMDKFYKTYVPKEFLPSDLGGSLPNLEQLSEETLIHCKKMKSYLQACEQQIEVFKENRS